MTAKLKGAVLSGSAAIFVEGHVLVLAPFRIDVG
jgi:hypothetical protein